MTPEDAVVGIVALNGGELIGRTRLQKTAFLLERSGMNSGLEFEYHRFGPFSAEIARGSEIAAGSGQLELEVRPGFHEYPYTIFRTSASAPAALGGLATEKAISLLSAMSGVSDVVLELAATIVLLRNSYENPLEEVKIRKPHKATPERLKAALQLITELGLDGR